MESGKAEVQNNLLHVKIAGNRIVHAWRKWWNDHRRLAEGEARQNTTADVMKIERSKEM